MPQNKKLFFRTVIGALSFGVVTIGLQAASHELYRAATRTVAKLNDRNYTFTVAETPVHPNDHLNSLGIHSDGYYYTCTVSRDGQQLSSFDIRREYGFHAEQVSITPLTLLTRQRLMVEVEITPDSGNSSVADCIILPPAPDERYGSGIINWRAFDMAGI